MAQMMQLRHYNTGNALLDIQPRETRACGSTARAWMRIRLPDLSESGRERPPAKDWVGGRGKPLMGNQADLANLAMQAQARLNSRMQHSAAQCAARSVHGAAADRAPEQRSGTTASRLAADARVRTRYAATTQNSAALIPATTNPGLRSFAIGGEPFGRNQVAQGADPHGLSRRRTGIARRFAGGWR